MKRLIILSTALCLMAPSLILADAEADRKAFTNFFTKRFKEVEVDAYKDGIYAIDAASREQWESIEEFPPYELDVDAGQELYETAFANGKSYASCFGDDVSQIRGRYPQWDAGQKQVVTLELAINQCRESNGEEPLKYKKGKIAQLSAYIAMQGRGEKTNVVIPDDAGAKAAYEKGKQFYYSKSGQLNFSCSDCHLFNSGNNVRADRLSPALGHTTHWPVYRSKWNELGTLHRRFAGCQQNVRAQPFKAQSEEYRNLEYFLAYMSNGLELNGPGARK